MLKPNERQKTITWLYSLQVPSGAFRDRQGAAPTLQATLSGIKALQLMGKTAPRPDDLLRYVLDAYDEEHSAFVHPETRQPDVLLSAAGLLILKNIGERTNFQRIVGPTVRYMIEHAQSREEHFMLIAVIDECQLSIEANPSIQFFRAMEQEGVFGDSVLNNAIAASALLRVGEPLMDSAKVLDSLLRAQSTEGAFLNDAGSPDLWTTYCVCRALDLLGQSPKVAGLLSWLGGLWAQSGGFKQGQDVASAGTTYQVVSILDWVLNPVFQAADLNTIAPVQAWLDAGGSANVYNPRAWSLLLTASAKGSSDVVKQLLTANPPANDALTYEEADLLPVLLAAQAGDLDSVRSLLTARPEQLFAISSVNGHNVLLQAAFYGSEKHRQLAGWILEHIDQILDLKTEGERTEAIRRLMSMTNVRGYNCTSMTTLWSNQPMQTLFSAYDTSTPDSRKSYLTNLLNHLAEPVPADEEAKQSRVEKGLDLINSTIQQLTENPSDAGIQSALDEFKAFVQDPSYEINRLAGPLSEPTLIVAITGENANEAVATFRYKLCQLLLEHGADPDLEEKHPMAVDAVIRAAVLNHFDILQLLAGYMPPLAFAAALNHQPPINGQSALQDTVHRALTASPETLSTHLSQITWMISKGARTDIEDHTGASPEKLARKAVQDPVFRQNAGPVLKALGIDPSGI